MLRRALLKQYVVVGFTEGIIDMFLTQQEQEEEFIFICKEIKKAAKKVKEILSHEGVPGRKDLKKVYDCTESFKNRYLSNGKFEDMLGISFCADLLVDQISYTKGRKHIAYEFLLSKLHELDHFIDPNFEYDNPKVLEMTSSYKASFDK